MGKINLTRNSISALIVLATLVLFLGFIFFYFALGDKISAGISKESSFKGIKLQKMDDNQWLTIYDNLEYVPFLQVGDYFIVGSETYSHNVYVKAYNMKSGKETVLYHKNTKQGEIYVSQIYNIENTIFFSISGYWSNEEMYHVGMPLEKNKIIKIEHSSGGNIREIEGNYWIWDGGGDVCWSYGSYSLFDPKNKKIIPVAKYDNYCGDGNDLIIAKDMVLNLNSIIERDTIGTSTYTHVTLINIKNPQKELDLISKDEMPPSVFDIEYDKENNALLLTGNDKYIYDLDDMVLVKKEFVKTVKPIQYQDTYTEHKVRKLNEVKLPDGYRIDFSDKSRF